MMVQGVCIIIRSLGNADDGSNGNTDFGATIPTSSPPSQADHYSPTPDPLLPHCSINPQPQTQTPKNP